MSNVENLDDDKADEIIPGGMSYERREYLFEKIRQFCSAETKDILCPKPVQLAADNIIVSSEQCEPSISAAPVNVRESGESEKESAERELMPCKRRKPVCSFCKQSGHRNSVRRDGTFWCPQRQS